MKEINHNEEKISDAFGMTEEEYTNLVAEVYTEIKEFNRFEMVSEDVENFPIWLNEGSENKSLIKYLLITRALRLLPCAIY